MAKISKEIGPFIKHVYKEYSRTELPDDDVMDIILIEFFLKVARERYVFQRESVTMLLAFMYFNKEFKSGEIMRVYNQRKNN